LNGKGTLGVVSKGNKKVIILASFLFCDSSIEREIERRERKQNLALLEFS
jgi:hypothetical protein